MERFDLQLTELLAKAEEQGYLTYDQVNAYLPDETTGTEAVDRLLSALDRHGIEVMDDPKSPFALPALDDDDAAHEGRGSRSAGWRHRAPAAHRHRC